MTKSVPVFVLFVLIVFEGYVVLSLELLAIRQTVPFVGSGTDTISIIIAAVLMPLAFGYQAGGRFKPGIQADGKYVSPRTRLIRNMLMAMLILLPGLSYAFIAFFFTQIMRLGIDRQQVMILLYSLCFIVVPVFLLGQTIPLISHYFSKEKLSSMTGKMLCFSTLGSFLGSIFSTLVLMVTIGVHHTVSLNFIILAGLIFLLSRKKLSEAALLAFCVAGAALYINSDNMMTKFNIVENNQYNTITVFEKEGERHLVLNNNGSSMYSEEGHKHDYIEFIEDLAIEPIIDGAADPKDILVIGAGAFTLGLEDKHNHYDYIDIDASLLPISEKLILKQKLTENKAFHPVPARAFLTKTQKQYDLIVIDVYIAGSAVPEHLITIEFFEQVKRRLKPNGSVIGNFIASPNFANRFSRTLDNTLRRVFPYMNRYVVKESDVWNQNPYVRTNVIYTYTHFVEPSSKDIDTKAVYTDNINRVFYDIPHRIERSVLSENE